MIQIQIVQCTLILTLKKTKNKTHINNKENPDTIINILQIQI